MIDSDERVDADRAAIAAVRARLAAADRGIAFATFAEAVDAGSAQPFVPLPDPAEGRDHISMIMYTSGSTGAPKGALIHDAISIQFWS